MLPLLLFGQTLLADWRTEDPDALAERLRLGAAAVQSEDPFTRGYAVLSGATGLPGLSGTPTGRFVSGGVEFVLLREGNRPVALVRGKGTLGGTAVDGEKTPVFRPERRNPALDALLGVPNLPPIWVCDREEFRRRVRSLGASVPAGWKLRLVWNLPVVGPKRIVAPFNEEALTRFARPWLRPEWPSRLRAEWTGATGEFRQEALVYARSPLRLEREGERFVVPGAETETLGDAVTARVDEEVVLVTEPLRWRVAPSPVPLDGFGPVWVEGPATARFPSGRLRDLPMGLPRVPTGASAVEAATSLRILEEARG